MQLLNLIKKYLFYNQNYFLLTKIIQILLSYNYYLYHIIIFEYQKSYHNFSLNNISFCGLHYFNFEDHFNYFDCLYCFSQVFKVNLLFYHQVFEFLKHQIYKLFLLKKLLCLYLLNLLVNQKEHFFLFSLHKFIDLIDL